MTKMIYSTILSNEKVPMEDLHHASNLLVKALKIRDEYMTVSNQRSPEVAKRFIRKLDGRDSAEKEQPSRATIDGKCWISIQKRHDYETRISMSMLCQARSRSSPSSTRPRSRLARP